MKTFLKLIFFITCGFAAAQDTTNGIGKVIRIEELSKINLKLHEILKKLNDGIAIEELKWRSGIAKLNSELSALIAERDSILADMKVGAKCSECGRWKSALEKEGINFEEHLKDVKGVSLPAGTKEIEETRRKYTERIALKKVQITRLEGKNTQLEVFKSKIEDTSNTISKNKLEIITLAGEYDKTVTAEANQKHDLWTTALLDQATAKIIAADLAAIARSKISREKNELNIAIKKLTNQLDLKYKIQEERLLDEIKEKKASFAAIKREHDANIAVFNQTLSEIRNEISRFTTIANNPESSNQATHDARKAIDDLNLKVQSQLANIRKEEADKNRKMMAINQIVSNLNSYHLKLPSERNSGISQAVASITNEYEKKIKSLEADAISHDNQNNTSNEKYKRLMSETDIKSRSFTDIINGEVSRIMIAARDAQASVSISTGGTIAMRWNMLQPCINNVANSTKPASNNVFNSYSPGDIVLSKMVTYKNFLSKLNNEDLKVVKENSNSNWLEAIEAK